MVTYFVSPLAPLVADVHFDLSKEWSKQKANSEADPANIGEVTPEDYAGYGWRGGPSFKRQSHPWLKRRDGSRPIEIFPDGTMVTVDTRVDLGPIDIVPHGTPNAWMGRPETDHTYYTKIYDPLTITPEEFAALPVCVQERWNLDDDDCDTFSFDGLDEWLLDDAGDVLTFQCDECVTFSFSGSDEWLLDDAGDVLELSCPDDDDEICDLFSFDGDDEFAFDEAVWELSCPDDVVLDTDLVATLDIELGELPDAYHDTDEGFEIEESAFMTQALDAPEDLTVVADIELEEALDDAELTVVADIELEETEDDDDLADVVCDIELEEI